MGTVIKITLQFHARFWPVENFGFIHAPDEWLATWWADERGPLLTAWAGGPRAERLSEKNTNELLNLAISTAGALFNVDPAHVRDLLEAHYVHDWSQDPFSRGAYSYIPVGKAEMPGRLAEPVDSTLFFAGEATDTNGNHGTVHGALESGKRAANEILSVCKPVRSILRKAGAALSEAFVG
jgi:monoamine oxidase